MSFLSCWENFFAPWGHVWASILAGCLWAVSDFTCVEVIYKQAQASGLCIWMAERCDKTEARWSLPYFTLEVCFLRSSQAMIIEDCFSCHFDPWAYIPARSRRRREAGQHCHSQTCVGALQLLFSSSYWPLRVRHWLSGMSSPTLSYPLQALQATEWGFQGLCFQNSPNKNHTLFLPHWEDSWLCQKCRFFYVRKKQAVMRDDWGWYLDECRELFAPQQSLTDLWGSVGAVRPAAPGTGSLHNRLCIAFTACNRNFEDILLKQGCTWTCICPAPRITIPSLASLSGSWSCHGRHCKTYHDR